MTIQHERLVIQNDADLYIPVMCTNKIKNKNGDIIFMYDGEGACNVAPVLKGPGCRLERLTGSHGSVASLRGVCELVLSVSRSIFCSTLKDRECQKLFHRFMKIIK